MTLGIVAADLEGTLTQGETWRGLARWLVDNGYGLRYRLFVLRHLPYVWAVKQGWIERTAFTVQWMTNMLHLFRGFSLSEFEAVVDWVVEQETWAKRRQSVVDELHNYHQQGHKLVIVSGAYQPVVEAFGRRLGVEAALGSPIEVVDDRLTGRTLAPLTVGQHKVEKLKDYLGNIPLLAAYGDTRPDIGMLGMSQNPVAVNPDAALRAEALQKGWRILEQ